MLTSATTTRDIPHLAHQTAFVALRVAIFRILPMLMIIASIGVLVNPNSSMAASKVFDFTKLNAETVAAVRIIATLLLGYAAALMRCVAPHHCAVFRFG